MACWASVIQLPMACAAATSCFIFFSTPPPTCFTPWRKIKNTTRWASRISSSLGNDDHQNLLRAALTAASIRSQETLRPDPLFIDPYAGCFLSSDEGHPVPMIDSPPCHYRLATKVIDDKLLSLMSSTEDLRQIVLLTGGMDTRPYRLRWPRSTIIFDISPASVYDVASERLAGIGAKISRTCLLSHVPLESFDLQTILCKKGFSGNRPSLWVLQGLPLKNLTSLKDILFITSSLAMKGSIFMGELPGWLLSAEFGDKSLIPQMMEKMFMSSGFQVELLDYDEVARDLQLDPLRGGDNIDVLFIAKQLRLSDAQMESWWAHFQRIEEEADEEGFEEM